MLSRRTRSSLRRCAAPLQLIHSRALACLAQDQQRLNAFLRGNEEVHFPSILALRTTDSTIVGMHLFTIKAKPLCLS